MNDDEFFDQVGTHRQGSTIRRCLHRHTGRDQNENRISFPCSLLVTDDPLSGAECPVCHKYYVRCECGRGVVNGKYCRDIPECTRKP